MWPQTPPRVILPNGERAADLRVATRPIPHRPSRPHVGTSNPISLQLLYRIFVCVSEDDEMVDRSPAGSGRRGAPGAQPEPASCLSATGEQVRGAAPDPASRHSHHTHSQARTSGGVGATPPQRNNPPLTRGHSHPAFNPPASRGRPSDLRTLPLDTAPDGCSLRRGKDSPQHHRLDGGFEI